MATIKAGTYRFNDVLGRSSIYDGDFENLEFTFATSGMVVHCTKMRIPNANEVYVVQLSYYVAFTEPANIADTVFPVYDNGVWDEYGLSADDGYKTITLPTDTEVTAEFAEWFSANAVEQKQISGKWKFKDVPALISTEEQLDVGALHTDVNFKVHVSNESANIDTTLNATGIIVGDITINYIAPDAVALVGEESVIVYSIAIDRWLTDEYGEDIKTIDFGTETQYVSVDFYNWLTANATQPTATITYNGSTIASLFGGQTATLKCKGMKMESDVVVDVVEQSEGGGSEIVKVPHFEITTKFEKER